MTPFECPKCGAVVETLGTQVWHPCPAHRHRDVELRPVLAVEPPAPGVETLRLFD